MSTWKWIVGIVLAMGLIALGFTVKSCGSHKIEAAALAQADKLDAPAVADLAQGANSAAAAEAKNPAIQAGTSAVKIDRAKLAMDQASAQRSRPVQPPSVPGSPDPQPVAPPVESVVEQDKDQLIADLTKVNSDQSEKIAFLESAYKSADAAAHGFQAEAASLRIAVSALAGDKRVWAAGASYGSNGTAGAFVERDLGPFRAGVDVMKRPAGNGNSTLEAVGRLAYRF